MVHYPYELTKCLKHIVVNLLSALIHIPYYHELVITHPRNALWGHYVPGPQSLAQYLYEFMYRFTHSVTTNSSIALHIMT